MSDRVTINRLPTGVPGLDTILGGGLPEFSFNLLAGPPGSGKTTLAHQMMFALANRERPALYLTVLGEPPVKMLRYQQQFEFFDVAEIHRSVHFVNMTESTLGGDVGQVLRRIVTEVEVHRPALLFIDSFRSLALASWAEGAPFNGMQHFLQQLGVLMTTWQATTFLLGEFTENEVSPVFSLADGLIWLRQSVQRNTMVRKIEITKMRGQPTLPGLHTFRIRSDGVTVFPPVIAPTALVAAADAERISASRALRLGTGVPRLDEMLGGGLPSGYSLLVAGPSGSGKSVLAAAFLAEGARRGETGVVAAFEQRPSQSRDRTVAELIEGGLVGVVDSGAPDLSVDEVMLQLTREIQRRSASRVVIDSLSGFELAIAPTFRHDFRESLARMIAALADAGVTVLMTSELEDRYTDLRFSPYGTAFMTDAIIMQRYIEVESRLLRVMAVVKVRASPHSKELRLFSIDDDGICIGESVHDQEGLLGGRPTIRQGAPDPSRSASGVGEVVPRAHGVSA